MSALATHRRISVKVGAAGVPLPPGIPPLLAMVVLAPPSAPFLSDLYPDAVVRAPNLRRESVTVEQVRLSNGQDVSRLPGLNGTAPSLLRDAVRLAFSAGAGSLDVVSIRIEGVMPWELDHPLLVEILEPLLEDLHETILLYPDLCGPPQLGPGAVTDSNQLWLRISRFLRLHRDGWSDRYQTVFLDAPDDGRAVPPLPLAADVAMVRWRGSLAQRVAHGWRSGAAALGGLLVADGGVVIQRVDGRYIPLPPGRWSKPSRETALRREPPAPLAPPSSTFVELDLDARTGMARVEGEMSFRAPSGAWPLPALRTVKSIHRRVVMAAELFTFQPVHPVQAVSLALAIAHVLKPYVEAGVIVGSNGQGLPIVDADVVRDPAAPGLVATLAAQVRPWCNIVRLKVDVQAGSPPRSLMVT